MLLLMNREGLLDLMNAQADLCLLDAHSFLVSLPKEPLHDKINNLDFACIQ